MSQLILSVSGTNGAPVDQWDIDGTLDVARVEFNYSGAGGTPAVSYFTVDPSQPQLPENITVTSVTGSYRMVAPDSAGQGALVTGRWRTSGGVVSATDSNFVVADDGADSFSTYVRTVNAPTGGWTGSAINGGALGAAVVANNGASAPSRCRWAIRASGVNFLSATFNFTLAAPTAVTTAATAVTPTSAQLNGTVNASGGNSDYPSSYKFQWGLTAAYGNETTPVTNLTGSADTNVSGSLSGLTPNTTYHFRVVAYNGDNTVNGSDQTFLTSSVDTAIMVL